MNMIVPFSEHSIEHASRWGETSRLRVTYQECDSFSQMLDIAEFGQYCNGDEQPGKPKYHPSKRHDTGLFKRHLDLCRYGWEDGAKAIDRGMQFFVPALAGKMMVPAPYYSFCGGAVNVGRALAGDPHCMRRRKSVETEGAGNIFRIMVNMSANQLDMKQLETRGGVIASVVSHLDSLGYGTEVWVADTAVPSANKGKLYVVTIPVKRAGEHLDIPRLAYAIAHQNMQGVVLFGFEECIQPEIVQSFKFHEQAVAAHDLPKEFRKDADLFFERYTAADEDKETATAHVQKALDVFKQKHGIA